MQHAAGAHAPAHVVDGAALHDVAVDDRAPAADLHETLRVAVVLGEDALLVEAGARAALVDSVAEQPRRPAELVERRQRTEALQEEQDREDRLGEVVALRRAPRDIDHRETKGAPIVLRRGSPSRSWRRWGCPRPRDAAPRRTGADGDRGRGARRQAAQPGRGRHRLRLRRHRPSTSDAHGAEIPARPSPRSARPRRSLRSTTT